MSKSINYGRSFLLWYAHDLLNFRLQEFCAVCKIFNITFEWLEEPNVESPFLLVNFPKPDDAKKIMSRTVLVKAAYELWAKGKTLSDLHSCLKDLPRHFMEPYCSKDVSFRVMVESFGKKISMGYKVQRIEELEFLEFDGPINLMNPDQSYLLMEYYGADRNNAPELPLQHYFGRWVGDGQRRVSQRTNLRCRKFIGNTSMDPLLALLMANLAGVQNGHLVFDPFVGSGGLLVAAAHFGGYVLGTDIDWQILHAKAKPSRLNQKKRAPDESIRANMQQYGYESRYLDVAVADASLPLWKVDSLFDVIITDPPYGIRESTERIGTEKDYKIPDHLAFNHIPSKVSYSLQHIIADLLHFSSISLKLHGRLVYWMPAFNEDFDKKKLPQHPCLQLIGFCKQELTGHSSRFLITMEKIKHNVNGEEKGTVPDSALTFRKKYFEAHKKLCK